MLVDTFGRQITYVRLSVTDRCNMRCHYCMADTMQFVARDHSLALDEFLTLAQALVELGVEKIRVTGGEPLIYPEIDNLLMGLRKILRDKKLAITTNGTYLATHIETIKKSGVNQLNISLDSLIPERFKKITRVGQLSPVLAGIDAACKANIPRIRLNAVVQKGINDDEIESLIAFAIEKSVHIAFIEEMPLGLVQSHSRAACYLSHEELIQKLAQQYHWLPCVGRVDHAGPARYYLIPGTHTQVGFISPHSCNFCHQCNRIRLTHEGRILYCLGHEKGVDVKTLLRQQGVAAVKQALISGMQNKPERHVFNIMDDQPQLVRFMNSTGG